MSNQNGNEQELAENGTNAENDNQQQQKKPLTAFVQIVLAGSTSGQVKVELSQNCSTVDEHASFLLEKINESQGNLLGFQLNCPVELAAVSKEDMFLMDHNLPLDEHSKYIFKFKLANFVWNVQGQGEDLAKQVAQLAKEKEELKKLVDGLAEKLEEEKRMAPFVDYARLIGVPTVATLSAHYDKQKLLQLIEHGNMPSIYIQNNQRLNDEGLLQNIVDLLATAEKPMEIVGEVKIEHGGAWFAWPKREELKLKCNMPNVAYTYNEASASPTTHSSTYLAEYELTNRGCHFQVLIHYWHESNFNKSVSKFIYRRLP